MAKQLSAETAAVLTDAEIEMRQTACIERVNARINRDGEHREFTEREAEFDGSTATNSPCSRPPRRRAAVIGMTRSRCSPAKCRRDRPRDRAAPRGITSVRGAQLLVSDENRRAHTQPFAKGERSAR